MQNTACSGRSFANKNFAGQNIIRAMKLTIVLLTVGFMNVYATGMSQNVSFTGRNVPLELVFKSVKKQTGYVFMYTESVMRSARPVSISAYNTPLEEFLNEVFRTQPLQFDIKGKSVFISQKPAPWHTYRGPADLKDTLLDVSGRVVNDQGEPAAVTIAVKGSKKGTSTNENGFFQLKNVEPDAVLLVTGIGIQAREIQVNGSGDLSTIIVGIRSTPIDEIQVIAYGTTSRRFLTGAVTTVKSETIQKQPVTNLILTLQGRVPGLIVKPGSGLPGATTSFQIRGQNTLASSGVPLPFDQPLIIIDGVPFAPQNQPINMVSSLGTGYNYAGSGSPFGGYGAISSINPNDIESVTVLRDADATSIYGSQGANGVILIKTKKGEPGETSFNVRVNTGPNKVTRRYEYLTSKQYFALRREAIANDGLTLPPAFNGEYPDLQLFDSTRDVDWFNVFLGGISNNTDAQASLTGGTENTSFILSAGYNKSTYNFPGDFAAKRMSLHSGFQYRSKNNKLTIDFGTDFSYTKSNSAQNPDAISVNKLPPNTPELLDENGNLIWSYKGFDLGYTFAGNGLMYHQQYAYLKQPYVLKTYNWLNSLQLTYKLVGNLNATMNVGYSRNNSSEIAQYPIGSQSPNTVYGRAGNATFAKNEFETFNLEPQLNFHQRIGDGEFTAIVGSTYKLNNNIGERIVGVDYTNDGFLGSLTGAGRIAEWTSHDYLYKYIGVFGRANYVYKSKYILNLTGRRDGSSNFGPGKQFGTFASAGAGWIVSEEKMFAGWKPALSLFKISVNYGTNGSDGISAYNYLDYWTVPQFTFGPPFQGLRPYLPNNLYNPDYSWALKKSLNIMADIGLFNDRLMVNAVLYRDRTGNQLVDVMLPSQTGFSSVIDNLGATVQNSGIEISVSSTNIKTKNFSWTTTANWYRNSNKLVAYPDLDKSAYASMSFIGESTSTIRLFKYKGVNETTGLFEFYDSKGQPTYEPSYDVLIDGGDFIEKIDLQPGFTGGFENIFSYKGLSLSVFFQFAKQRATNYLYAIYSGGLPGMYGNVPSLVENRWKKPGDKSPMQRASSGMSGEASAALSYFLSSSGGYGDASYLRLKTLALSYDLPDKVVKKCGMENFRIYANIQNLLTFTGYEIGDPEQPGVLTFPLQKTIAVGLMFNF
ncbi:MAG: SusC/RagA family TonB-linked outer membrane protein [Chitinophagaceae bacterium]|nr:SusC/RagA family TonB-linked outer membrane protein [Chitinophagaceae bacterium]